MNFYYFMNGQKIIISSLKNIAAILQNNKVQEIIVINKNYQINNIYIGTVQKIFSSINAAFIKLSHYNKSGFIHISDIKTLNKHQKKNCIQDILFINQLILVQVIKESTLTKGPRLTSNIHLYGIYVVLMPFCNTILISNNIYDNNERIYLYSLAILIKPELIGLFIKSSAQKISESLILKDLDLLLKQWFFIQKLTLIKLSPYIVYKDEDLVKKILCNYFTKNLSKIIIDSEIGIKLIYYYLKRWYCFSTFNKTKIQLYTKKLCILERFCIMQVIKKTFIPIVKLLYGGSLFIEVYEALTIIDVNSGSFNKFHNSKKTILKINCYAAIEISYQLKLRNINGVILIDFIDMYSEKDRFQLINHFNLLLKCDDCKPKIVQFSYLGLLELTRHRKSQSLQELFSFSNLLKFQSFNIYCFKNLYFNLFFNIFSKYLKHNNIVNKNIYLLFFSKKFYNNNILKNIYFFL
uniref:Ribonuclease E/G-like protein n=1 Tax=Choreocolax polysiphoniae TaxID=282351 RepID=A0A0B5W2J9_9FLOR|nr:ribonuclease E/G-like protein [Choreocolax polysiphoniae]AJH65879.1 ribonuclease E/G-like protein [Choreocolax polysiphoniae]